MLSGNTLKEILEAGVSAPSIDNCQPYLFSIHPEKASIDLYIDAQRADFFGDYNFLASYITIGAVIENMLIAAAHHALASTVDLFPDINEGSLVATIRFHKDSTDESYPYIQQ
mgnify:CR=1 FL=1